MSALNMITTDTWKPFVVESIVQRMANMLNYVLKLLVGEKSRELKVFVAVINLNTLTVHSSIGEKCPPIELQA